MRFFATDEGIAFGVWSFRQQVYLAPDLNSTPTPLLLPGQTLYSSVDLCDVGTLLRVLLNGLFTTKKATSSVPFTLLGHVEDPYPLALKETSLRHLHV
jgi:hypothetical protein